MISGIYYQSSGLGNQLHRYIATRVLAKQKGYDWGMLYYGNDSSKEDGFKGSSFMEGDFFGKNPVALGWPDGFETWTEKKVIENGVDIRPYDPEINFVADMTVIDGEFQDQRYFERHMQDIGEWLKTEPMDDPGNVCVIGFRGGEYSVFPELFLTREYWDDAIKLMREKEPGMQFVVHTDDPTTAKLFFPYYPIVHNVGLNWRSVRYAKYAIIANSSFYILPRLLAHHEQREAMTIAPRYWARRNTKVWALPQNYYKEFIYL